MLMLRRSRRHRHRCGRGRRVGGRVGCIGRRAQAEVERLKAQVERLVEIDGVHFVAHCGVALSCGLVFRVSQVAAVCLRRRRRWRRRKTPLST